MSQLKVWQNQFVENDMQVASIGTYIYYTDRTINELHNYNKFKHIEEFPSENTILKHAKKTDILVTWGKISKRILDEIPKLKLLIIMSTGYEEALDPNINKKYCKKRGLNICYTPGYSTEAVAEYTYSALRAASRKLFLDKEIILNELSMDDLRCKPFSQMRIGVLGMGNIGQELAKYCFKSGAKVLYYTRNMETKANLPFLKTARQVNLEELFSYSDAVAITCQLNKQTKCLVGKNLLELMPDDGVIVNSARPEIFNLKELSEVLMKKTLMQVIIDGKLPDTKAGKSLRNNKSVVLSPHIAFNTLESLTNCTDTVAHIVSEYKKGNIVNNVFTSE